MISRLPYATFSDYCPKGTSDASQKSKNVRASLKRASPELLASLVRELLRPEAREAFGDFLNPGVTLVPTPRSSLLREGDLWPSLMIANALKDAGLAVEVLPCLQRLTPVPKSSMQERGHRNSVQTHYDSFGVTRGLLVPANITIIDDIISMGRTVFAGACRLQEAFPDAEIRVFGVMRTRGFVNDIDRLKHFVVNEITKSGGGGCMRHDPEDE